MIPLTWAAGCAVVAALIAGGAGLRAGMWWVQAQWDRATVAQQREQQRQVERVHEAAVGHEVEKAGLQAEERIITKEVTRVVTQYRDRDCLDPDGLRQLNAAITGAYRGEPAPALPAASAAR
jgi:hypothetical protein